MSNKRTEFGKGQKYSFGLGTFVQWFINTSFNIWVFSFYFTAVGLPVIFIMTAFIIWSIWNAFNDPFIGFLSDRTHTRWGRRKPFIIFGTIPIIIIEIILWIPPTSNHFITFLYLIVMLISYDVAFTCIALPYDSLFPELYTSVEDRAEVNAIKQVLSAVGLILAFLVPGIFIGDLTQTSGYLVNGIVTSIIIGISLLVSILFGVREREEFKFDHEHGFGFLGGMKYTLKNKAFVLYTIMYFLYNYFLLTIAAVIPLFALHVLNLTTTFETSILFGTVFIVGILTVPLWSKIDINLGGRKGYAIAIICYFIPSILLLFVSSFIEAVIVMLFMGFGFGGMLYFIYLIIADVIDEDELRTGVRREGTYFGITNFFMRLSTIMAIVTVSLVFTSTGWETYEPNPGADVILGLRLLVVLFPGIALGLSLICLYLYPYPKERVLDIKKELVILHEKKLDRVKTKQ